MATTRTNTRTTTRRPKALPHLLDSDGNIAAKTGTARPVTLKDVALLAGVDKGAVSVVLNGARSNTGVSAEKRQIILSAARKLNYRPNPLAQRLATPYAGKHIDIFALKLDAAIGVQKIKTIQGLLIGRGYDVPVHSYDFYGLSEEEESHKATLIRTLRHQRPRAIVCATPGVSDEVLSEIRGYVEDGGIAVCYDDLVDIPCDNVVFDTKSNLYRAANYLISYGHRDIGFYWQGNLHPNGALFEGFVQALNEAGIEVNPQWIFGNNAVAEEGGALLARDFLALEKRPTAMCVISDRSALGFMVQLERAGVKVPEDVSVIGHDNLPVADFCPVPLTSVSHPALTIATEVFELLNSRLDGNASPEPRRVIVQGELIERQSVGAPRK